MEEDQDMINPLQFGQLLVDWTDPSKIVNAYVLRLLYWSHLITTCIDNRAPQDQTTSLVHVHLAIDLVKAMYDNDRSGVLPSNDDWITEPHALVQTRTRRYFVNFSAS